MEWWDNLWLNEGFASWMQNFAADHIYPVTNPRVNPTFSVPGGGRGCAGCERVDATVWVRV